MSEKWPIINFATPILFSYLYFIRRVKIYPEDGEEVDADGHSETAAADDPVLATACSVLFGVVQLHLLRFLHHVHLFHNSTVTYEPKILHICIASLAGFYSHLVS